MPRSPERVVILEGTKAKKRARANTTKLWDNLQDYPVGIDLKEKEEQLQNPLRAE